MGSLASGEGASRGSPRRLWVRDWMLSNVAYLSPAIYAVIPTEKHLVFQTDGLLCGGPDTAARLAEYWQYDYVGAPWAKWEDLRGGDCGPDEKLTGGNGGLSLRSKSVMLRIIGEHVPRDMDVTWWLKEFRPINEDLFLSSRVVEAGGRLPTVAHARAFSVETCFHPRPLGFHKPWGYLPADKLEVVMQNCPVLRTVHAAAKCARR